MKNRNPNSESRAGRPAVTSAAFFFSMLKFITSLLLFGTALGTSHAANTPAPALIPLPAHIEPAPGTFTLGSASVIVADAAARPAAESLAGQLRRVTGFKLEVRPDNGARKLSAGTILLTTRKANVALCNEGYELLIGDAVILRAPQPPGIFYGTQTLLQLLPPEALGTNRIRNPRWSIAGLRITDQPRFAWRGMMLDVGRHYFPVTDIKRMLDAMALHKLNTFHWHLTEDQGWRIEIKKYPRLTEIGAWRDSTPPYGSRNADDGQRHGGFYTQDEVRDIVAYAAARHITVIPEIEMPGHAAAAIAAYPELGNSDIPGYAPRVMTRWGVHPYVFAPKEETFRFLEDVLTEVCELFPSKFIHIGGDEAPKDQWKKSPFAQSVIQREGLKDEHELQSWFIRRIEKFLATKGRRLVGWDEIQEGGLPETATMMVWRDAKWAKHALALGNDVVMATTSHTYLDYYQAPAAFELAKGLEYEAIGGFLPLEKVYSYNPTFVAENPAQEKQILGTQGQLWGEYFKDIRKAQYMAFPRLSALAEVAWTPQAARDFADFRRRLETHFVRLDQMGLRYHRDTSVELGRWKPADLNTNAVVLEFDVTPHLGAAGRQLVGFSYQRGAHGLRLDWVALLEDGREVARDAHAGFTGHQPRRPVYALELPSLKPGARYTVRAQVAGDGGTDSFGAVHWQSPPPGHSLR